MTEQEINAIVAVQRKYFQTGATLPVSFRIDALRRLYDAVSGSEKERRRSMMRCEKIWAKADLKVTCAKPGWCWKRSATC